MPTEPDVHPGSVRDRLLGVDDAVGIRIAEAPDVGRDGQVEVILVREYPVRHIRHEVVEILEDLLRVVGDAIAVRILQAVQSLLVHRQVTPVAGAVPVPVLEPLVLGAPFRRQHPLVEGALVLDVLEDDGWHHPVGVCPDVDLVAVGARRARRVQPPPVIERDADWIRDEALRRPQAEHEPRCDLRRQGIAAQRCEADGRVGREPHDARRERRRWFDEQCAHRERRGYRHGCWSGGLAAAQDGQHTGCSTQPRARRKADCFFK